jgi:hypothetical protein
VEPSPSSARLLERSPCLDPLSRSGLVEEPALDANSLRKSSEISEIAGSPLGEDCALSPRVLAGPCVCVLSTF